MFSRKMLTFLFCTVILAGCAEKVSAPTALEPLGTAAQVLTVPGYLDSVGYNEYTVSGTAVDLTDGGGYTVPGNAHYIVIAVEDAPIRWLDDGTTPTTDLGMPLSVGGYYFLPITHKGNFKMIRSTGTDATVHILFRGI